MCLPDGLIVNVHPLCGQVPPHSRDLLIPVVTSEYVALYRSLTMADSHMIQNLLYDKDLFRTAHSVEGLQWFKILNADPDPAF
jgi:hypothetical protein